MPQIYPATPADLPEIDALLDAGFGLARHGRTAYRLRDNATPLPALSFTARDNGQLAGSLQCWPVQVRGPTGIAMPLILLGPVVTAAAWQRQGIATRLMNAAIAVADDCGAPPLLLIGDRIFYGRFGFGADATAQWRLPGPVDQARLLLRGDVAGLPRLGRVEARDPVKRAA